VVDNAGLRLHATFTSRGASVRGPGGARFAISLASVGVGSALRRVGEASPVARRNVVDYRWPGIDEWYANGPAGIEQGFTIARSAAHGSGPFTLSLALSGARAHRLDRDRSGVVLSASRDAGALIYSGLTASDAHGRSLPATLSLSGGRLRIRVDVRGAAYPVTIDPFIQSARLTASDGIANDQLGSSVAISDNTVVVGAPDHPVGANADQGAVYVYVKQPGQPWSDLTQAAELVASDGAAGDQLGTAVAIEDNTIVAGAPHRQEGSNPAQGAVYVFPMPAGGWGSGPQPQTDQELFANGGSAGDLLGSSLAITSTDFDTGGMLVAGAPGSSSSQGAAYVFLSSFDNGVWGYGGELLASDGTAGDHFGQSVGISGDCCATPIVVGAPGHGIGGAAYVYSSWSSSGTTQTAELSAADGASGDGLGASVAISSDGDTVVAGAPGHNSSRGAGYLWSAPVAGWASGTQPQGQTAELTAGDGASGDLLGTSIALSPGGDTVLAGAPGHQVGSNASQGEAYEFDEPGSGAWSDGQQTQELADANGAASEQLGASVGLDADAVLAGAPGSSGGTGQPGAGAAAVFFEPLAPVVTESTGLFGTVNPENSATSYHFEYASYPAFVTSGWSTATEVPVPDADVGSDGTADPVSQTIADGDQNLLYVARLVATNQYGTTVGPTTTFTDGPIPLPLLLTGTPSLVRSTTATLSWTASADNFALSDYSVTCTPTGSTSPPVQMPATSAGLPVGSELFTLTTPVTGLRAGTAYRCSLTMTFSGGDQAYEGVPFTGAQTFTGPNEGVTTLSTLEVTAARARVTSGSSNGTTAAMQIACSSAIPCAGTVTDLNRATGKQAHAAAAKQVVIGRTRYRVKAHHRAKITFRLSSAGRRLARREHRLRTTVVVTVTEAHYLPKTTRRPLTIAYRRPG
jgi:hypothetical protein